MGQHREAATLISGQAQAPTRQLGAQRPVPFDHVGHGRVLSALEPSGQRDHKKPERGEVDHSGSLPQDASPAEVGRVLGQYGHTKVDTTMNVYTQVLDGAARAAADRVGSELFRHRKPRRR